MEPIKTFYSRDRQPITWRFEPGNGRTEIQFEMMKDIAQQPDFDHMTDHRNPFGNTFRETSSLTFAYHTKDGLLHTKRIGRKGTITRDVITPTPEEMIKSKYFFN